MAIDTIKATAIFDGTIGASDIADGAIGATQLGSTLDLSGKTVTYGLAHGDMPSGSVIQVVHNSFQSASATATNSTYATTPEAVIDGYQTEIQCLDASSKILVIMDIHLLSQRNGPASAFGTIGFDTDTTSGVSKSASDYTVINTNSGNSGKALYSTRRAVSYGSDHAYINGNGSFSSAGTMHILHTHAQTAGTYLYYTAMTMTSYTNSSPSYDYNVLGTPQNITLMEIKV